MQATLFMSKRQIQMRGFFTQYSQYQNDFAVDLITFLSKHFMRSFTRAGKTCSTVDWQWFEDNIETLRSSFLHKF